MRILYVAMRHEYGDPDRGLSYEENNFRSALEGMGHELSCFDFLERTKREGAQAMRSELVRQAAETAPDLAFFCLFTDELDVATIEAVRRAGGCPTVNWFGDDHWRFESFSRHMAPAFDLAVTTDPDALEKYRALRGTRVHLSQWACNRYAYRRTTTELRHDVTFVGQPHGDRRQIRTRVANAGLPVERWGFGWPADPIGHAQMIDVFASSRINLNLSNSSQVPGAKARLRRALHLRPPT